MTIDNYEKNLNKIWKQYNKTINDIASYLQKKSKNITPQEFLFLHHINNNKNISPAQIAKDSNQANFFTMFNLNSLERKKLISIISKSNKSIDTLVNITDLGNQLLKDFKF